MKKIIIGLILGFYSILCFSNQDINMTVDPKNNKFSIVLAANPTTGFQWSIVSYDHSLFTLLEQHYDRPNTKLVGAGGKMIFTFGLKKHKKLPPQSTISFSYARSWEPKTATLQKVNVRFK